MKKKIVSILLCAGLIVSLLAGCGGSQDKSDSELDKNETQSEEAAEDEEKSEEESGELNEYGLTAGQQEALLASVQASVTEGYLEKYSIPAADFKLLPYDANDMNNYDSSGQYTGLDPYKCANVWWIVDQTIYWSNCNQALIIAPEDEKEEWLETVLELDFMDFTLEDTIDEQNQKNIETGMSYTFDTSTESYDLENAVYMGIAKFLNQLDEQERAEVLYELYTISDKNSEQIVLDSGLKVKSTTMFDKVISENIQFE